ncbi:MAG TPA: CD225/dispanin family protein [Hanamia sp.]|nr:CD225/dispanin family protein [Hanamia sp.]
MEQSIPPQNTGTPPVRPKNWLVESILVTIFCCLPFGIPGIVFASQVNSKYDAGDYPGAEKASKQAKTWTLVSFIIGIASALIWIIIALTTTFFSAMFHHNFYP